MENIKCELCKTIVTSTNLTCPNCKFPVQGDMQEKSAFRMKLVDVRFWLQNIEFTRDTLLKFGGVFLLLGLIMLVLRYNTLLVGALAITIIGGVYIALYGWSRREPYLPFLIAPFFYSVHTLAEIWIGLLPYEILPISVENGWIGVIPILVSLLPYLYAIIRIGLVWLFIKGLLNAIKIKNNPRVVDSYIAVHGGND